MTNAVHELIHTYDKNEVAMLLRKAKIKDLSQIEKLNLLRKKACRKPIDANIFLNLSKGLAKETKTTFN